ncbi:hypothetical protein Nepgr_018062 [Nepenthes gracilis]|uniref:Uncharacterized protein n=1 Tax=Nepenthes gracilis TaxID=150966 RepID=A0AAD3SU30_NEPGR|nr:hypothetical protein Nepgr_018062 [Nepenthes gracilis]
MKAIGQNSKNSNSINHITQVVNTIGILHRSPKEHQHFKIITSQGTSSVRTPNKAKNKIPANNQGSGQVAVTTSGCLQQQDQLVSSTSASIATAHLHQNEEL